MEVPTLVLVSGAPGSGKSTLARQLAQTMHLPHMERDSLMWGLRYTQGDALDREKVGIAAYYRVLAVMLHSGISLVTDATLYRGKSEADIVDALLPHGEIVNVHCRAENDKQRFYDREVARNGGRPSDWLEGHLDHLDKIYDDVIHPLEFGARLLIEVDTTSGYAPTIEEIAGQIGDNNSKSKDPYGTKTSH